MEGNWTTKWTWNTGVCADSVEWCPVEGYRDILVCGTYQLDENKAPDKTQTRIGKIYLFNIKEEKAGPIQTIVTSGILDQKWCEHEICETPVVAAATSTGTILLHKLLKNEESFVLKLWTQATIGENVLALSLDWSTNKYFSNKPQLLVSDSSGSVTLFSFENDNLVKINVWRVHGFEAWITAFNYWNADVFYSGGDDCLLKILDRRLPDVAVSTNKSHEAGVTALRCHAVLENKLISGSYDEKIRLFDTRNFKVPVSEVNAGGCVWRLKWHPHRPQTILSACMHGGFRVINMENEHFNILYEYLEHSSIGYGADWRWDDDVIATCSFYDCRLDISEIKFN